MIRKEFVVHKADNKLESAATGKDVLGHWRCSRIG